MSRRIRRDCLLTVCLSLFGLASVWADTLAPAEPQVESAVVTDAPVAPQLSSRDVAREVLRLQEELGGSITTGFGEVPPWAPSQSLPPTTQRFNSTASPIRALREVAWQLDQSAYLLESLDLYEQADSLRETAGKLRNDARGIKGTGAPNDATHPKQKS
jgi:hypothetical protein